MIAAGLLAFSFMALALGAPTPDVLHVHDARSSAPAGYKASGAPDPNEVLNLRIALKADNTPLVQKLLDVSTPGSKNYRKFLSKAQVRVVLLNLSVILRVVLIIASRTSRALVTGRSAYRA